MTRKKNVIENVLLSCIEISVHKFKKFALGLFLEGMKMETAPSKLPCH